MNAFNNYYYCRKMKERANSIKLHSVEGPFFVFVVHRATITETEFCQHFQTSKWSCEL